MSCSLPTFLITFLKFTLSLFATKMVTIKDLGVQTKTGTESEHQKNGCEFRLFMNSGSDHNNHWIHNPDLDPLWMLLLENTVHSFAD